MTLNELLGSVVGQLQSQEGPLNAADPNNPTHGSDMLGKFQAAQHAASSDPSADLGQVFSQVASAIGGHGNGFTSQSYSSGFQQAAQAFQGRPNQLSASDLGPIIGAITQGFGQHNTRSADAPGPMSMLGPILGMLTGNQGGGLNPLAIAGSLLGGGGVGGVLGALMGGGQQQSGGIGGILGSMLGGSQGGALGGMLGSMLDGGQQQQQAGGLGDLLGGLMGAAAPQQQGGGLGDLLGGLMGAGQAQQPQQAAAGDILGQLMGAINQHSQQQTPQGHIDAGAASTGAVLNGILGALLKH
jgi:hypothetical protein